MLTKVLDIADILAGAVLGFGILLAWHLGMLSFFEGMALCLLWAIEFEITRIRKTLGD